MHAVRRTIALSGLTGLLVLGFGGTAAWADDHVDVEAPVVDCDFTAPEPDDGSEPATGTATIEPDQAASSEDEFCIAAAMPPGAPVPDTAGGGETVVPVSAPAQLPRTGPAPLAPTLALGASLVLLGLAAAAAGRRRTASHSA